MTDFDARLADLSRVRPEPPRVWDLPPAAAVGLASIHDTLGGKIARVRPGEVDGLWSLLYPITRSLGDSYFPYDATFVRLDDDVPGVHVDVGMDSTARVTGERLAPLASACFGKVAFVQISVDGSTDPVEYPGLTTVYFAQRWVGKGTNFTGGATHSWANPNRSPATDGVLMGRSDRPIDPTVGATMPHVPTAALTGLSVETTVMWRPGRCAIFDANQVHAASDHRAVGHRTKAFVNVAYRLVDPTPLLRAGA